MNRIPFNQIPQGLMACMMQTEEYLKNLTGSTYAQLELMRYYASVLNGCAYCIDMHFKEATAAGESALRLYSAPVWRETRYYSAQEQALLHWTEVTTQINTAEDERQQAFELMQNHFSKEQIADLTLAIVQINSWNRLAKNFGFPPGSYQPGQHA
ncbi:MAG: carboxymuconolactone decarboxylase family protein [Saccharospirillaceae bacterium]|nr:carboxymuconolactone decarboxylase family protein [Saccharospirillaceae bacterium]MCD8533125.1 carboxymuconolactone decarboxylase family protein [Saccharospirillaceae bacterium]